MSASADIVFLVDVDNTLLDNDRVQDDLKAYIAEHFGEAGRTRYWQLFETLRDELGYVDYLGAFQRFRFSPEGQAGGVKLYDLQSFLLDYPFSERVYYGALAAIEHLKTLGRVVILSDGDIVLQPRKIERSGLFAAVEGNVLIFVHKEEMLASVEESYPATHYVMVDDKLPILTKMKKVWGARLTTVFPRQGHYAFDEIANRGLPAADLTVAAIGELCNYERAVLLSAGSGRTKETKP